MYPMSFLFSLIVSICSLSSLHSFYHRSVIKSLPYLVKNQLLATNIDDLKLDELKIVIKQLGGKPRNLRKDELIAECKRLHADKMLKRNSSSTATADLKVNESSGSIDEKATVNLVNNPFVQNESANLAHIPSVADIAVASASRSHSTTEAPAEPKVKASSGWVDDKVVVNQVKSRFVQNATTSFGYNKSVPAASMATASRSLRSLRPLPGGIPVKRVRNSDSEGASNSKWDFPIGENRTARIYENGTDMDITFLGTASCTPTKTRGVSCVSFRYNSNVWMFDCGESSQIQLQRSRVTASKISKIFITHSHGDHCFGLPGVLCMLGQAHQEEVQNSRRGLGDFEPIDIYGPEGIRDLVRAVIQLSYSRVAVPHRIHELKNVPYLHGRRPPQDVPIQTTFSSLYGEMPGGTDIYPDAFGTYRVYDGPDVVVHAAPMQHTVPCLGYVVTEKDRPGRLKIELIDEIYKRNAVALKQDYGMRDPRKVLGILKQLQPGQSFKMPDGTELGAADVIDPPKRGRKIVFMGDTCNGEHIAALARGADVLIHEATNAFHPWNNDQTNYNSVERETFQHGHSTPQMAGRFSRRIGAKKLILTHFSSRYCGDSSESSMRVMWSIEDMARSTADLWGPNDVIAAWDHLIYPVAQTDAHDEEMIEREDA